MGTSRVAFAPQLPKMSDELARETFIKACGGFICTGFLLGGPMTFFNGPVGGCDLANERAAWEGNKA